MDRLIIIMIMLLGTGILYSYIVGKFTANKWILYLPTYLGIILILYYIFFYHPSGEGFQDLAKVLTILLLVPIVLGNAIGNVIMGKK